MTTGIAVVSVPVLLTGGVRRREEAETLLSQSKADLIIAKGMANYESLSDQDAGMPKVHILRTKCSAVANSLNVPEDINVVRVCDDLAL